MHQKCNQSLLITFRYNLLRSFHMICIVRLSFPYTVYIMLYLHPQGKIELINGIDCASKSPNILFILPLKKEGDDLGDLRDSSDRALVIIVKGKNTVEAEANAQNAFEKIQYKFYICRCFTNIL